MFLNKSHSLGWGKFFSVCAAFQVLTFEPPRDKTNNITVRRAKTQISLGIRPVWSESLLSALRKLGALASRWAHSKDSDQTGRMPRLIWVFAGRRHFVSFVMRRLICDKICINSWFWLCNLIEVIFNRFKKIIFHLKLKAFFFFKKKQTNIIHEEMFLSDTCKM